VENSSQLLGFQVTAKGEPYPRVNVYDAKTGESVAAETGLTGASATVLQTIAVPTTRSLAASSSGSYWVVVGNSLGKTVTILREALLPNQTAAAAVQLANAKTAGQVAANLVWTCEGTIYRGLLVGNETLVAQALNLSFATIAYAPGLAEGIKADASFFEHGNQLYSGGYG
jgi:hypothetical protein